MDDDQKLAIRRLIASIDGADDDEYCAHEWNVLRWLVAYSNDEQEAAKALKRHLNIRRTLDLDNLVNMVDVTEDELSDYAPIDIIGQNHPDENMIFLFERTGKIDISGLVENVLMSKFMNVKLKMMETLHQKVTNLEMRTGRQCGGIFVMDLEGLTFSTKLLSILTGPYRVMWGTLFDHYPQLLQKIVIVNAPSFANILHQACSPFLPEDYRKKIHITSEGPKEALSKFIHESMLPIELGGTLSRPIAIPRSPFPAADDIDVDLKILSIPAGKHLVHKYQWQKGEKIQFYLQNESSFHYFMFHSNHDTNNESEWKEMSVGCERPPLNQIDHWRYSVPLDGFYYIRYGNQNSWYFSTIVKTCLMTVDDREILEPIDTFIIS